MKELAGEGNVIGELTPSEPPVDRGSARTREIINGIVEGAVAANEPIEKEGEPNVEGMKLCLHCGNPVQYEWTAEQRTKTYCSEFCRKESGYAPG